MAVRELELSGYRVVTPDAVLPHGSVRTAGERIVEVGAAGPGVDRSGHWLVPGFVDLHVHGGGGHTFTSGDVREARHAARFHLAHGTTTLLASLVAGPLEAMTATARAYRALVDDATLAGVHWEGPYLSLARCGVHRPRYLRTPDADELDRLLDAAAGTIRTVTIAPELRGAIEAIHLLRRRGVRVAIGHTDATYEQTALAVRAGATMATHLFNAMPAPASREPGPVLALLGAPEVTCELIADGVHLHDAVLAFAARCAGPDRIALVTDATAVAGMPDGGYELDGQPVLVHDGVARLTTSAVLAGSTLTMDAALRHAVRLGLSIVDAVRAASTTPARALGLTDRGAIAPGLRADLVVLDEDLRVRAVLRGGSRCR